MERVCSNDYLTGLADRRELYHYYETLPEDDCLHAMFLDVDNFKRVNDVYGHSMGDALLIQIAHLIEKKTKAFTSRIGGDEYVVLFPKSVSKEEITAIASSLLTKISEIDFRKDILSLVSLSIGIVLCQNASQSLDNILSKCDLAMYRAKYDGKNCFRIYEENDKTIEFNRNIEFEMERALEEGQFQIYIQPKLNCITSKLISAEALSRWVHPIDGVRLPGTYIPLFEKNGFISKLDMYVFSEVCRVKSTWKGTDYEHVPVSVNLSRLHLYNKNFPDQLEAIASSYGIPNNELELEISENTFIIDRQELICMVSRLKERGFLISIDDFGSGFSALSLLKDLSVDTIKLDKTFLHSACENHRGRTVIRNIISMCKDLKMSVVTEGVETKEQVDLITSCGCQIAQGFYFAPPLVVSEFEHFADAYIQNTNQSYTFSFDGTLLSSDGSMKAKIVGEGLKYDQGIFRESLSMYFPGGATEQNTIHIPTTAIVDDSYTISMWIKPAELHLWTAALYVKFESGFLGMIPLAWEGHSSFRIRDSKEVNGWYDITGSALRKNIWYNYAISYNAKTETAIAYINGEVVGIMEHVPTNRFVKWIILGGDVFQQSFVGHICELKIFNETKDYDFMKKLHESYVNDKEFIAFDE